MSSQERPRPLGAKALFPSFVVTRSVRFTADDDRGDVTAPFPGITLPPDLQGAVRKRQIEFLAGRYCAREALRVVAPEHADTPIAWGPRREPLWPSGVVGSITHSHGLATASVASSNDARAIGLDTERMMPEEQAGRLLEQIACREEIASLARATGWANATVLSIVFSAKETIFKCLYPEVQRYFDFRDAAVTEINRHAGCFRARLLTTLTPSIRSGMLLEGRFEEDGSTVSTAIVLLR